MRPDTIQSAHSPRTIKCTTRRSKKTRHGTILQYHPTLPRWVHLPEKFDRSPTHTDRAPKIHLEQRACISVGGALNLAQNPGPGIVEHDVESSKGFLGAGKGGGDVRGTSDVEGEDEELGGGVLLGERGENGGFAKCGDDDVAFAEDNLGEGFSEPRGRTSDCQGRRSVSVSQYLFSMSRVRTEPDFWKVHEEEGESEQRRPLFGHTTRAHALSIEACTYPWSDVS